MNSQNTRIQREVEAYENGLQRETYNKVLDHANNGVARQRETNDILVFMHNTKGKKVLELGSSAWSDWVDFEATPPEKLICINISDSELERGIIRSTKQNLTKIIDFKIMDAHNLDFKDETFDLVFGSGILHHLNLEESITEIKRVLKPGGKILFKEPLRDNPISILVRLLTPKARTPDEFPLGRKELKFLEKNFTNQNSYYQLLIVPFSILNKIIRAPRDNFILRSIDKIDIFIEKNIKIFRPFFRYVIIKGEKI